MLYVKQCDLSIVWICLAVAGEVNCWRHDWLQFFCVYLKSGFKNIRVTKMRWEAAHKPNGTLRSRRDTECNVPIRLGGKMRNSILIQVIKYGFMQNSVQENTSYQITTLIISSCRIANLRRFFSNQTTLTKRTYTKTQILGWGSTENKLIRQKIYIYWGGNLYAEHERIYDSKSKGNNCTELHELHYSRRSKLLNID